MKAVIEKFKSAIVQLSTPYSKEGTGFYLAQYGLIVTNEHVVRDNREVVVTGKQIVRQIVRVLFLDHKYDLAFLEAPKGMTAPELSFADYASLQEGTQVIAVGHPFDMQFSFTRGVISKLPSIRSEMDYIVHDAALNHGNSGGPLINEAGQIVGINTFVIEDVNGLGFALPVHFLQKGLDDYSSKKGQLAARCLSCASVIFETTSIVEFCPHCGASIVLPSTIKGYEPTGVPKTIEEILVQTGHEVRLARRGMNEWEIEQGSAKVKISYHEDSGLLMGDAYLCQLPKEKLSNIYAYLLKENLKMHGLTFSVPSNGQDIMLSLLIYDRYLNVDTGVRLFQYLFEQADFYDNILVEQFGARWNDNANGQLKITN